MAAMAEQRTVGYIGLYDRRGSTAEVRRFRKRPFATAEFGHRMSDQVVTTIV